LAGFRGRKAYVVGAGVVAALSPSCEWDVNLRCAMALVRSRGLRSSDDDTRFQSRVNCGKGARILSGELPLDVLGGAKVRSFYVCILDPSDPTAVCVDRHAAAVAYGFTMSDKQMSRAVAVLASVDRYEAIAEAYRAVASARGLLPLEVQAVTWVAWRRLKDGSKSFSLADTTGTVR
jgi:hypothetical protein